MTLRLIPEMFNSDYDAEKWCLHETAFAAQRRREHNEQDFYLRSWGALELQRPPRWVHSWFFPLVSIQPPG
jgi:hypothetical protein